MKLFSKIKKQKKGYPEGWYEFGPVHWTENSIYVGRFQYDRYNKSLHTSHIRIPLRRKFYLKFLYAIKKKSYEGSFIFSSGEPYAVFSYRKRFYRRITLMGVSSTNMSFKEFWVSVFKVYRSARASARLKS